MGNIFEKHFSKREENKPKNFVADVLYHILAILYIVCIFILLTSRAYVQ